MRSEASTDPTMPSVAAAPAASAAEPESPAASTETETRTDPSAPPQEGRRRRRYRRRLTLTYRPVYPIRALWLQASEEERRLAHERCTAILEYWVGIVSKKESAARLNIPPIRLWQMSQRAVSGMACALLKPPKSLPRRGSSPPDLGASPLEAESSPAALRKEIARLKRDLEQRNNLIEILKSLPMNQLTTNRSEKAVETPPSSSASSVERAEHAERKRPRRLRRAPHQKHGGEESPEASSPTG
jgi:hypothetical protein